MSRFLQNKLAAWKKEGWTRFAAVVVSTCMLTLFVCTSAWAQATATLNGVVQDPNGEVVPNAKVTVADLSRGLVRNVVTNNEGQFTVPLLPPATYTVTVEQTGFATMQVNDVVLNVADNRTVSVQLQIKQKDEVVIVDGADVAVRVESNVSTTIDKTFVQNMPLNGRSFSTLVLLTPGVTLSATGDGGAFSVNGQRSTTNVYTIDGAGANIGASITPPTGGADSGAAISGALPGTSANGSTATLVSLDALEEFKVQTSTYSAALGRQPGGQIQLITRSGTNKYHGSLFEYFRNEALDARNYFNRKPATQTPLRQNIFGGTFGGPVLFPNFGDGGPGWYSGKNKTFFFFSYEGQRLRVPVSILSLVPSIRFRDRLRAINSALLPLLDHFPVPTEPETLTTTNCPAPPATDPRCDPISGKLFSGQANFRTGFSETQNLDATSIRVDQRLGKRSSVFARYNHAPSVSQRYASFALSETGSATDTLTIGAIYNFSPNLINDLRVNWSKSAGSSRRRSSTIGGAVPVDRNLVTRGNDGTGSLSILALTSFTAGDVVESRQQQFNIVDNLTYVTKNHQFQFGGDFRRLSPIYDPLDNRSVSVSTESAAVAGTVIYTVANSFPARPRFDNLSLYAQDSWKASRRLTLDLGLRWEFNPAPTEANGLMPTVITGIVGSDVTNAALGPVGTPFYKTHYIAFAPRFGVAYLLRESPGNETVIRGGFGVYYDLGSGAASRAWPFQVSKFLLNIPFPLTDADAASPTGIPGGSIALNEDLELPVTMQWNVAAEQSLGKYQTLSVSYVAAAGRGLLSTQNVNRLAIDPVTGTVRRPNANFGDVTVTNSNASSDYHSMQIQYKARLKDRLQALVNYTWSHAIDDVSVDTQTGVLERGNANFDVRHNLSAAVHYELPSPDFGGPIGFLLRDWSTDLLIHAQSGLPFSVNMPNSTALNVVVDGISMTRRPDLILGVPIWINDPAQPGGRRLNTAAFTAPPSQCLTVVGQPGCTNVTLRQGTFGRNVLRNLPVYQADVALARTFRLRENLNLQLKGEVFNAFNHPMFRLSSTETNPTGSNFGVPSTTLNNNLGGGLSGLYQIGGPRSIQVSVRMTF